MPRKLTALLFVALLLVILPAGLAVAEDAAEKTTLRGFVDASWFYETSQPNGEFGLDQAEVDVMHQASEATFLRADLEWIKDGEDYLARVEQAFVTWTPPCGWAFSLGKFNAPIGFELLDPDEMYQFSHSLVFDHGVPTNLTGANVAKDLGRGMDLVAYAVNGWDRQTADANVTWGGRLGYAQGGFSGGVSAISGKEVEPEAGTPFTRTVLDVDLSYLTGAWIFGGEFNRGHVSLPADSEADWTAFLVMGHVDFNGWSGLTLRYDRFDDGDAWVFEAVGGQAQVRQSFTVAPTFVLDEGFGALVELRVDKSDQDAFVDADGEPTDTAVSMALEMTYSW